MVRFSRPQLLNTIGKLEGLSVDLREILDGMGPDIHRLQGAPTLDQWRIVPAPFPVLVGNVAGHPRLSNGEIVTSQVFLLEDGHQWARTFSRYYLLGESAMRN